MDENNLNYNYEKNKIMQPTQQQIDDFLKNATEEQKRNLLKYAINEKVIDEALKHYDWENATEEQKQNILKYATNEKVKQLAKNIV